MPRKKDPSYHYHKARNCAVVTIAGHNHYLGEYDSDTSWEEYHRLTAEYRARLRQPPPPIPADAPLTVMELIARYWRFAKSYYVKDGKPTSEIPSIKFALGFVRPYRRRTAGCEFSPKKLKAVREAMITHEITRKVKVIDEKTGHVNWAYAWSPTMTLTRRFGEWLVNHGDQLTIRGGKPTVLLPPPWYVLR